MASGPKGRFLVKQMRKRRSKYTKETLSPVVKESLSYREVLRRLGYSSNSGSMFYLIRRKISEFGIDTTHFKPVRNKGVKILLYLNFFALYELCKGKE